MSAFHTTSVGQSVHAGSHDASRSQRRAHAHLRESHAGRRWSAEHEYPLIRPRSGWRVQDPAAVVDATLRSVAEVVSALDGAPVLALSVSTAMHGLIGLDDQLRSLTPLVTWAAPFGVRPSRTSRWDTLAG